MYSRISILAAAVIIQACLGGVYAWSVIVGPLQQEIGFSNAQGQLIFGTTIATFTGVMVVAGRVLERHGPRRIVTIGALLFAAGYLVAVACGSHFIGLLVGIGFIAGAGIGCAYVCPLATAVRWFPHHRGLVTGITVAGMGGGAIVLSTLATAALNRGVPVLHGLLWLGLGYGLIILLCGQLLRFPAGELSRGEEDTSKVAFGRDPRFWAMVIGMFCGTFAGLLVVGNLKTMGQCWQMPEQVALGAVSLFAVGNAAGRVCWGVLADRVGTVRTIGATLVLAAIGLGLLPVLSATGAGFLCAIMLIALAFGGCFVLFAAHTATTYGARTLPCMYPWVFLAYGVAALAGPLIGGWLYDVTHGYLTALYVAMAVSVLGAAAFWCLHLLGAGRQSLARCLSEKSEDLQDKHLLV